jgi:transglutaminase-like putative cysteine protease
LKCIDIKHITRYTFDVPVTLGPHRLLLRPREGHDIRIASSSLRVSPEASIRWNRDYYENVLAIAVFEPVKISEFTIESRVEAELYDTMPLDFIVDEHAVRYPFEYTPEERTALSPFLISVYERDSTCDNWLMPFVKGCPNTETYGLLDALNRRVHNEIEYETREMEGVLSPTELLHHAKGSCRDTAALFLESCRWLGIAARFVSGYIHNPATQFGGASSHAWAEVYLPGAGWKGFDPTNGSVVGGEHIPVAVHRHPEAIPPVAGTFTGPKGTASNLTVDVRINMAS